MESCHDARERRTTTPSCPEKVLVSVRVRSNELAVCRRQINGNHALTRPTPSLQPGQSTLLNIGKERHLHSCSNPCLLREDTRPWRHQGNAHQEILGRWRPGTCQALFQWYLVIGVRYVSSDPGPSRNNRQDPRAEHYLERSMLGNSGPLHGLRHGIFFQQLVSLRARYRVLSLQKSHRRDISQGRFH